MRISGLTLRLAFAVAVTLMLLGLGGRASIVLEAARSGNEAWRAIETRHLDAASFLGMLVFCGLLAGLRFRWLLPFDGEAPPPLAQDTRASGAAALRSGLLAFALIAFGLLLYDRAERPWGSKGPFFLQDAHDSMGFGPFSLGYFRLFGQDWTGLEVVVSFFIPYCVALILVDQRLWGAGRR